METTPIQILTFYHFHPLDGLEALRDTLLSTMQKNDVRGTILLAPEGINATISGTKEKAQNILAQLRALPGFAEMQCRESIYATQPFGQAMVKIREELISLGDYADPHHTGQHVPPAEWNALIAQPDVLLIDGRNSYEAKIGKFSGAVDLGAKDFKDFPALIAQNVNPAQHKRVAMYCTGGIRCEKLAAHCLAQGIEEVYQLEGGILHYLETMKPEESAWEGDCYVFDERVAVGHGQRPQTSISFCPGCGHPLKESDWSHPLFYPGIRCAYC